MDYGLDTLLSLHGTRYEYECGYWYEIIAYQVEASLHRPHGIKYSLTLHDHHNQRIFGMDNAHAPYCPQKAMSRARIQVWDHVHNSMKDKGTPFDFIDAGELMNHFFSAVERIIAEATSR